MELYYSNNKNILLYKNQDNNYKRNGKASGNRARDQKKREGRSPVMNTPYDYCDDLVLRIKRGAAPIYPPRIAAGYYLVVPVIRLFLGYI